MKFQLARQLQERFATQCPTGWKCRRESPVLAAEFNRLLGYRPQADILLQSTTTSERIWIELEVSRADPVANHAKFASAHLVQPFPATDAFVSMVSRHIVPGRANLAAHAVFMLRQLGLRAFQMPLFPELDGSQIKDLNHNQSPSRPFPQLDIKLLIDLTHGVGEADGVSVHYATNAFEVVLNASQWNRDMNKTDCMEIWGTRRLQYFVWDHKGGNFAPSKFCAYTLMPAASNGNSVRGGVLMSIPLYTRVDQENSIFDGQKAWKNLVRIGFTKLPLRDAPPPLAAQFLRWFNKVVPAIQTDFSTVELLCAPN